MKTIHFKYHHGYPIDSTFGDNKYFNYMYYDVRYPIIQWCLPICIVYIFHPQKFDPDSSTLPLLWIMMVQILYSKLLLKCELTAQVPRFFVSSTISPHCSRACHDKMTWWCVMLFCAHLLLFSHSCMLLCANCLGYNEVKLVMKRCPWVGTNQRPSDQKSSMLLLDYCARPPRACYFWITAPALPAYTRPSTAWTICTTVT